jgi:hypothetical protein
MDWNVDYVRYVGGTKFDDIVDKVGPPDDTNEMDIGGTKTITATWSDASWSNADYVSIIITYDKASGMVTQKMYFEA